MEIFVLFQKLDRPVSALTEAHIAIGIPGPRFLNDLLFHAQIENISNPRDTLVEENVELGALERRRDLVLHDSDADAVADHLVGGFQGADSANVEAHGGVKLERTTTGRDFGIAEKYADLFADLIDEEYRGLCLGNGGCQFS